MPPILYHRTVGLTSGAGTVYQFRIGNLPLCRLRMIWAQNESEVNLISVEIIDKNAPLDTLETIGIWHREEMRAAAFSVGWEGDIVLGPNQDLKVSFELTAGVTPTGGNVVSCTVGYETI